MNLASLSGTARFHANVTLAGNAFLRWERLQLQLKLLRPGFWKHEFLAPPLQVSPRLKELISRHYLKGRFANLDRKVAWVTSGAPVEFLTALGFFAIYPENHGAVCGIRRMAEELCTVAEDAGYSRDLCSYARTDIGAVLSGKTPVGRLPRPDVLLCCTNICQTVLLWYQVLAERFQIPLIIIDTPFLYREAAPHAVEYVKRQLEAAIPIAERVAGRTMTERSLARVTRASRDAVDLWLRVLETGKQRPAPITAFDEFIHMAPIVEMRGEEFTVAYYRAMLAELRQRIGRGIGAVKDERKRLLWDNLPIWHRIRWLSELLARQRIALVASTYTNAWGELAGMIDPARPLESAAQAYLHPILNRGVGQKLATMKKLATDYRADGVILHSDRSCKPYSIGQVDERDRLSAELGVPTLLLEADHNDPRAFAEQQVENRLAAFIEMLG
jgi:benzoyl-CoA reductase/2-hydroxyglutaryl-CoA dehydratase subunit BcrC/BadD/HgdB